MHNSTTRIAVLIPAFNAARTMGELLRRLVKEVSPSHIVVVDDGSVDSTGDIVCSYGTKLLRHETNRGKGASLRSGFEFFKNDSSIDAIITLDADLQHRPEDIDCFIEKMKETRADIIIGRRKRIGTHMPYHRRLSNTVTSFLISTRTGEAVVDSQCGFRLISRRVIQTISLDSTGFEAETEFLIKAIKKRFRMDYVPIETIYDSEDSHMQHWEATLNFIRILFRDY